MVVIQSDGSLVAIGGEKIGRLCAHKRGAPAPRLVATASALDFDHVGAEIPKQHRAIGAGQGFREFNDSDPYINGEESLLFFV